MVHNLARGIRSACVPNAWIHAPKQNRVVSTVVNEQWKQCRVHMFPAVLRIHMFLRLPDPDPFVRYMDPDPSLIKQK
jgi:hypothetical protein